MTNSLKSITYEFIVNSASLLFFVVQRNGIIEKSNIYSRKLLGNDILGKNITDIILDFNHCFDLSDMVQKPEKKHLLTIQTENGMPQTYHFTFQLSADRILIFGQLDAEEIEEIRKDMYSVTEELNNLTRELHKKNAQLQQLNDQKNKFLGMAAHDIRSPINGIMMYSQFLLDEANEILSKEHKKFIWIVIQYSRFIFQLVDDLLDISIIESGKLELNLYPTNLVSLIMKTIAFTKPFANKKSIEIVFDNEEKIPILKIDENKINQALSNIIINAIKFSKPDTTITIYLTESDNSCLIGVQDQGRGIPEDEIGKLFDPFESTSIRSTDGEKSSGLGLAISKKVILEHKGKIWVESRVNKGSTFYISLPKR